MFLRYFLVLVCSVCGCFVLYLSMCLVMLGNRLSLLVILFILYVSLTLYGLGCLIAIRVFWL